MYVISSFKMLYGQLRELKTEIEHIQHLLEKAKVKLQKDFEQWWNQQSSNTKVSISTLCIYMYSLSLVHLELYIMRLSKQTEHTLEDICVVIQCHVCESFIHPGPFIYKECLVHSSRKWLPLSASTAPTWEASLLFRLIILTQQP